MDIIGELPIEICAYMAQFLPPSTTAVCKRVCKRWHQKLPRLDFVHLPLKDNIDSDTNRASREWKGLYTYQHTSPVWSPPDKLQLTVMVTMRDFVQLAQNRKYKTSGKRSAAVNGAKESAKWQEEAGPAVVQWVRELGERTDAVVGAVRLDNCAANDPLMLALPELRSVLADTAHELYLKITVPTVVPSTFLNISRLHLDAHWRYVVKCLGISHEFNASLQELFVAMKPEDWVSSDAAREVEECRYVETGWHEGHFEWGEGMLEYAVLPMPCLRALHLRFAGRSYPATSRHVETAELERWLVAAAPNLQVLNGIRDIEAEALGGGVCAHVHTLHLFEDFVGSNAKMRAILSLPSLRCLHWETGEWVTEEPEAGTDGAMESELCPTLEEVETKNLKEGKYALLLGVLSSCPNLKRVRLLNDDDKDGLKEAQQKALKKVLKKRAGDFAWGRCAEEGYTESDGVLVPELPLHLRGKEPKKEQEAAESNARDDDGDGTKRKCAIQ